MSTLQEFDRAASLEALSGVFPTLRDEIHGMLAAIDTRALQLLNSGTLNPDTAKELWVEKAQLMRLLKRFETKLTFGLAIKP